MSLFSFAQDAISYALNDEAEYVDVRLENVFKNYVGMRNSKLCDVNTQLRESIGVRILINGFWGFAATASLDTPSIKSAIESALLSAKKIAKKYPEKKSNLAEMTARKTSVADECKKSPQLIPAAQLKVSKVGLKAFQKVGAFVKPTTRMIQTFGHTATKARLEIDQRQLERFLGGEDLPIALDLEKGYVILSLGEDMILGAGFYGEGKIWSQIPRKELRKAMLQM